MITDNNYNKTGDKMFTSSNTSECRQTTNDPKVSMILEFVWEEEKRRNRMTFYIPEKTESQQEFTGSMESQLRTVVEPGRGQILGEGKGHEL